MNCPLETSACCAHGPCDKPGGAQEGNKADVSLHSFSFPCFYPSACLTGPAPLDMHPRGLAQASMRPPVVERLNQRVAAQACLPSWTAAHLRHTRRHRRRGRNVEFVQQAAPHESRE